MSFTILAFIRILAILILANGVTNSMVRAEEPQGAAVRPTIRQLPRTHCLSYAPAPKIDPAELDEERRILEAMVARAREDSHAEFVKIAEQGRPERGNDPWEKWVQQFPLSLRYKHQLLVRISESQGGPQPPASSGDASSRDSVQASPLSLWQMRKNHGKPYTQDQDAQIINLVKQGKSRKEIAEVMGRTEDSVNSRIRKLQDQGQIAY